MADLLARLGPQDELRAFCDRVLGRLLEHDRRTGGELVPTLAAYFVAQERVTEAAQLLGTHRNTVQYRLRRAREVGGLNLDDPRQRLEVQLALTIAEASRVAVDGEAGPGPGP